MARGLVALSILLLSWLPGVAGQRVALVVGNAAYEHASPLRTPLADAAGIAAVLKTLKFQVIERTDLTKRGFDEALREFSARAQGAEMALFYYSGHSVQVARRNYLLPVDATLARADAVDAELISLNATLRLMEQSARVRLLFIDASHPHPLERKLGRLIGTGEVRPGLTHVELPKNSLFGSSTYYSTQVPSSDGPRSPYAAALIKYLPAAGKDIAAILHQVRQDVIAASDRYQVPIEHSMLSEPLFLSKTADVVAARPAPRLAPRPVVAANARRLALVVGMSDYLYLRPLQNPGNDARLIARTLRSLGFEVTEVIDGKRSELLAAMHAQLTRMRENGSNTVAVVYLSGHGIQVDGLNYFLPVDANISAKPDVRKAGVDIFELMELYSANPNSGVHVLLDACSNEPFRRPLDIGQQRGLAGVKLRSVSADADDGEAHYNTIELLPGFLFGLAAEPGYTALDGDGDNSPFALAFVDAIQTEGWDSSRALQETSNAVKRSTNNAQTPWFKDFLSESFYFRPSGKKRARRSLR